jgi:hypothetical protein
MADTVAFANGAPLELAVILPEIMPDLARARLTPDVVAPRVTEIPLSVLVM